MATISLKAFDLAIGRAARFVVHDDGSLTAPDVWWLTYSLPGCRVIRRAEADARATKELAHRPILLEWRERQLMALKIVDVALWNSAPVTAFLDSDVLFFRRPDELLNALTRPEGPSLFNRDIQSAYEIAPKDLFEALDVRVLERANAGLWVMPGAALSLDRMEAWTQNPRIRALLHVPDIEQMVSVLLGSVGPGGAAYLPAGYDISFEVIGPSTVCRHFAGMFRGEYSEVGLPHLFGPMKFRRRWRAFVRAHARASENESAQRPRTA